MLVTIMLDRRQPRAFISTSSSGWRTFQRTCGSARNEWDYRMAARKLRPRAHRVAPCQRLPAHRLPHAARELCTGVDRSAFLNAYSGGELRLSALFSLPLEQYDMAIAATAKRRKSSFNSILGLCATLSCLTLPECTAYAASGSVVYTYDALGRIATANYDTGAIIIYSYDANGNRTSQVVNVNTSPGVWGSFNWAQALWN